MNSFWSVFEVDIFYVNEQYSCTCEDFSEVVFLLYNEEPNFCLDSEARDF